MTGPAKVARYHESQFVTTYDPPRLWCRACEKVASLASLDTATVVGLKGSHRCGPRTAPWTTAGLVG